MTMQFTMVLCVVIITLAAVPVILQLRRHPSGLVILFLCEMWERFSWNGVRALLVLYLTQQLLMQDMQAQQVYAACISAAWLATVIGGFIADRLVGPRVATGAGITILIIGYLLLSLHARGRSDAEHGVPLIATLAVIATGTGLVKPGLSTLVGQQYAADDLRRDAGFTLYTFAINLGALVAAVACGYTAYQVSWSAAFLLTAGGMLLAGIVFFFGKNHLLDRSAVPRTFKALRDGRFAILALFAPLSVAGIAVMIGHYALVGFFLALCTCVALAYVIRFAVARCEAPERLRIFLALLLCLLAVFFWSLEQQTGLLLTQFATRHVDLTLVTATLSAPQLQGLLSLFIMVLAPVMAALWSRLQRRRIMLQPVLVFSIGIITIATAFLVLGLIASHGVASVPLYSMIIVYILMAFAELCISPIGLSQVSRLVPTGIASTSLAIWFLSVAWSAWFAGLIAGSIRVDTLNGRLLDPASSLHSYARGFTRVGAAGCVVGLLIMSAAGALSWRRANPTLLPDSIPEAHSPP